MPLTITTFNVENLFNRYASLDQPWEDRGYEEYVQAIGLASVASRVGDMVSNAVTDTQRNNTANAILDSKPDILAIQEIESIHTLRIFNDTDLDNYFDRIISIGGIDPRVVRNGLSTKATAYSGPRYPTVGQEHTEASGHCPVSVVLDI